MIKNLVWKGGGVKGVAYIGVLNVLQKYGLLKNIEATAGTSAGAICATLVALKYTAEEINIIMSTMNFINLEGGVNYIKFFTKHGIHSASPLLNWMEDKIAKKTGINNATFEQLKAKGFLDLHIVATDLTINDIQIFSANTTPTVIVSEALRASISIPLLFTEWKFKNNIPNDHVYIDGGALWNYPLSIFDKVDEDINKETLGFYLYNFQGKNKVQETKTIFEYISALFNTVSWEVTDYLDKDPNSLIRTVKIDTFDYTATQFNLNAGDIQKLIKSGEEATEQFLASNKLI